MCLAGNEGGMFPLRITTSSGVIQSQNTITHTKTDTHTQSRGTSVPVTGPSHWYEQSSHDLKFDTKRMFSRVLEENVEGGCHAKQSQERKDCFQTFPIHQAIKMTFVCRLLALVSGHIANTWN